MDHKMVSLYSMQSSKGCVGNTMHRRLQGYRKRLRNNMRDPKFIYYTLYSLFMVVYVVKVLIYC